jgi:hypothetical protein
MSAFPLVAKVMACVLTVINCSYEVGFVATTDESCSFEKAMQFDRRTHSMNSVATEKTG